MAETIDYNKLPDYIQNELKFVGIDPKVDGNPNDLSSKDILEAYKKIEPKIFEIFDAKKRALQYSFKTAVKLLFAYACKTNKKAAENLKEQIYKTNEDLGFSAVEGIRSAEWFIGLDLLIKRDINVNSLLSTLDLNINGFLYGVNFSIINNALIIEGVTSSYETNKESQKFKTVINKEKFASLKELKIVKEYDRDVYKRVYRLVAVYKDKPEEILGTVFVDDSKPVRVH